MYCINQTKTRTPHKGNVQAVKLVKIKRRGKRQQNRILTSRPSGRKVSEKCISSAAGNQSTGNPMVDKQ